MRSELTEKRAVPDDSFGPLSNGGGLRGAKGDHIYEDGIRVPHGYAKE